MQFLASTNLLQHTGKRIMKPMSISSEHGRVILEKRRLAGEVDPSEYEGQLPFECDLELDIGALKKELEALRKKFPQKLGSNSVKGSQFDQEAAEIVHKHLPIDPILAACREFWIWLSVAKFPDIIEWRHGTDDSYAHINNYSLALKTEGLFCRLWFRAALSIVEGEDPYKLCRVGARDFWDSGIVRPRYSACRALTRAFAKFQYPEELKGKPLLHPTNKDGVRKLYKLLKRVQPTVAFELLDEGAATKLLKGLSEGLKKA